MALHVRRVVDPPAAPVLLLHGLGVGGGVFQAFARRLLPYLAAVAPDLRGHGQSDAPASGYSPYDYAADLAELIPAELDRPVPELDRPVPQLVSGHVLDRSVPVIGHSLGALVALALADLRPELVSWLALLDPPLDPSLRNPEVRSVYRLRQASAGELEAYLLERNPGGGKHLAAALAALFRQASDAAFDAMLEGPRFVTPSIEQPTLIVQADPARGGVLGDAAAREIVERLPRATLVKLAGATHAVHASHPAETARAILRFAGYCSGASSR